MEILIKETKVKSILTKSNLPVGDYSVNPYVGCPHACKYCYASFMKRFTGHQEPWGSFLDVKLWPEIKNPQRYAGKKLFIGSVTDPYHPLEERYRRTRSLLEQLQDSGVEISVATKSDLILRDLDLIKTFPNARVAWSINTLDESFRSDMDKAATIEQRLKAMKIFHDNGVRTTCFISPIFPEITDVIGIIERVKEQCNLIWLENLNLRGEYKAVILRYIQEKYPRLMPLYQDIYRRRDRSYWEGLDSVMAAYTEDRGLEYRTDDDDFQRPFHDPPVVVNYFYHEEIKKSAKKKNQKKFQGQGF
ncbi:MAG: radical SAM mobile pair protein B [Bacillota bacterium]|nr:radical SAM mobile pair protein B [Bacillota bacterium]